MATTSAIRGTTAAPEAAWGPACGEVPGRGGGAPPRAVQWGLRGLEGNPRRGGCVERVAALLEHRHPALRGEPVRRAHHAESAFQLWAGGEAHEGRAVVLLDRARKGYAELRQWRIESQVHRGFNAAVPVAMWHAGWKHDQSACAGNVTLACDIQAHRPAQDVEQLIDGVGMHARR